jgi:hypothetical protein
MAASISSRRGWLLGGTVFWRGHGMGWLKDETGRSFRYAVIPSAELL